MGYYEDQLAAYDQHVRDLMTGQTGRSADLADVGALQDRLGGLSDSFGSNVQDILGGQADPSVVGKIRSGFQRKNAAAAQSFSVQRYRDRLNQYYNYAMQKYQEAGNSLRASDDAARVWAKQQTDQEFKAQTFEDRRAFEKEKREANLKRGLIESEDGDPYQQAFLRSILGLGATAAIAAKHKYGGKKKYNDFNPKSTEIGYGDRTDYAV